jgi:CheY-like chemotaxis protein
MAKILVVDDDLALRELLKEYLEGFGHKVETAETGAEALTRLRAGKFDLVTMDMKMPLMGGADALKLIRRDPALEKLPVLMCTAQDTMADIDDAFANGASGYIVKPFDVSKLQKTVERALKS